MQQYIELLKSIKEKGILKPAARAGMPGTISLFGYQFRHDLSKGFPLLTTKKINFKSIIVELLWFLRGDVNIKYLVDNNCNIWNEDAYNYYLKITNVQEPLSGVLHEDIDKSELRRYSFEEFVELIKRLSYKNLPYDGGYKLGDCGYQYGRVWRSWAADFQFSHYNEQNQPIYNAISTDQIKGLIYRLKKTPESRRHIVTAIDPAHDEDLALYWCHCMFQFNCRPIPWEIRLEMAKRHPNVPMENLAITEAASGNPHYGPIPQYYLDCQLFQRSADVFLGVPFNIASYALLVHIMATICNMIPGDFIHTFGDVHIYENHIDQVNMQLERDMRQLPQLSINTEFWPTVSGECGVGLLSDDVDALIKGMKIDDFQVNNYNPHPPIKAKLSTGLK